MTLDISRVPDLKEYSTFCINTPCKYLPQKPARTYFKDGNLSPE
ncbi:MAG: hypothetical protein BACD_02407 [Bacteroides rodentium]|jgi:hypothetical protein